MRSVTFALAPLASLALASGHASAQEPMLFTIDKAQSQWCWTGTTSLGPIVGNPSNNFALTGDVGVLITSGVKPIAIGQASGNGAAQVVPDLSGLIRNPIPFLPPLAIIDVTNLSLQFDTPPFVVGAAGNFNTLLTVTVLSGTLTVTPLVGSPTQTDLTGVTGNPAPILGTLIQAGTHMHLNSPQQNTLMFTDPGSGISGSFTLTGILDAHYDCPVPTVYCTANPNSSGAAAAISSSGSTRIQDNDLNLHVTNLPPDKFGYFLMSRTQDFVPLFGGSQGNLCLGPPQFRFNQWVLNSGANGQVSFIPDMTNLPQSQVFMPGESWNFQLWYRDNNPGITSNTSDGLEAIFCP